ncbi:MAG: DUF2911 domain-containing protein [Bacteroidota bacterium]
MRSYQLIAVFISLTVFNLANGQALRIPNNTNTSCLTGRKVGVTGIEIRYNAPSVKGRDGKIYGTGVVPYGYNVLGFGSNIPSPWRAGADEATTMNFSTDVFINGKKLPAGEYAFFIEVQPNNSTLIFNKNTNAWGSYFYRKDLDVLQVATTQQKDLPQMQEKLLYDFSNETDSSVDINLVWERWRFPIHVTIEKKQTYLEDIRRQMSGALGFDPASLQAAAQWCAANDVNYDEALTWITSATDPNLGGRNNFSALQTKAILLEKSGKAAEARPVMATALESATPIELHQYGRFLMNQKKMQEAREVFEKNFTKNKGAWPSNVGLMRIYSANGDYKKALQHAKAALLQAPDNINKRSLEAAVKNLEQGKPV